MLDPCRLQSERDASAGIDIERRADLSDELAGARVACLTTRTSALDQREDGDRGNDDERDKRAGRDSRRVATVCQG